MICFLVSTAGNGKKQCRSKRHGLPRLKHCDFFMRRIKILITKFAIRMHKTKNELYDLIKDIKTKEEFEVEIKKRIEENDNLFDEETVALFIVDELGRNKQHIYTISELQPNIDCTLFGKIISIGESKSFERRNGSKGKVVNINLADNTGICKLVLWNDDVELVKNKTLQEESLVKIINGYTKSGFDGVEVHVGKWSQIDTKPEDIPRGITGGKDITNNHEQTASDLEICGELTEIQPTRAFFRDNGEFGFVTNIKIKDDHSEEKQLIIWGNKVREIQNLKIGEHVKISNVNIRKKNGETEIHVNKNSIIQKPHQ